MSDVLAEQKRYYAERAPEYDDWWFRRGRYALDPEPLARWESDVAEAEAALEAFRPRGRVLELAAGTGLWTRQLVRHADRVVAVDASPQTLDVNRARVGGQVEYVVADLFAWEPEQSFDLAFFSFWLSHVPEDRFDAFWETVRTTLAPGGRVFLVDSGSGDTAHSGTDQADEHETRSLSDGRTFRIVKRRWAPRELAERVRPLGFELELRDTAFGHFLLGGGELA
jgi:demethylmenaquinone methyltransferase/2-methoxy-6-polyprenyl-1,4-benzoquinol methylase